MGLSDDQIDAIQKTWGAATAKFGEKLGNDFFMRMFKDFPLTLEKFHKFNKKSLSELEGSPEVAAHSGKVIKRLGEMVSALRDPGKISALLDDHGSYHKKRNILGNYMDDGAKALVALFKDKVDGFSDADAAAWGALMAEVKGSVDNA